MSDLSARFERDGYAVIEGAMAPEDCVRLREVASRIVDDFDIDRHRTVFRTDDRDAGRDEYFFESAEQASCFLEAEALDASGALSKPKALAINKIGHGLHDADPAVAEFCRLPGITTALRELGWQDPVLQQTMYIFKQPTIGGEVRWHQDGSYLMASGRGVMGIWIALEPATRENGCLWMQPGAHRTPLRERYAVDNKTGDASLEIIDDTPWQTEDPVAMEVPAGSIVVFSDHMPHYSAPNRSVRSRHAFTLHVKEAGDQWLAENWLQRRNPPFRLYA
ncbi:MAG: phytanoyl-CoA dioxygenase family protein [Pseudomonadota bacterium]